MGNTRGMSAATIAVGSAILLAGVAGGATAAQMIGSSDIRNESIRSVDLKNGQVKTADLRRGAVNGKKVKNGSIGVRDVGGALKQAAATTPKLVEFSAASNGLSYQNVDGNLRLRLLCSQEFPSLEVLATTGTARSAGAVLYGNNSSTYAPDIAPSRSYTLGNRNQVTLLLTHTSAGSMTYAADLAVTTNPSDGCTVWGTLTPVG